jgi:hypothetical protein
MCVLRMLYRTKWSDTLLVCVCVWNRSVSNGNTYLYDARIEEYFWYAEALDANGGHCVVGQIVVHIGDVVVDTTQSTSEQASQPEPELAMPRHTNSALVVLTREHGRT